MRPAARARTGRASNCAHGPSRIAVYSLLAAMSAALMLCSPGAAGAGQDAAGPVVGVQDEERLKLLRQDIAALQQGIRKLAGAEQGVLGELKAAEADALAKQAELAQAEERLRKVEEASVELEARVNDLSGKLAERRSEVAKRLDALYRLGRPRYLRIVLASDKPSSLLASYRAAEMLSDRDARLMTQFRDQRAVADQESEKLTALRPILQAEQEAGRKAAQAAVAALERRRILLRAIQSDRKTRQTALDELQAAERSFGLMLPGLPTPSVATLGFDTLRGALDWPAEGPVSAPFGRSVSPRFGTPIEHSGIDIDAPFGGGMRAIFEGTVVFAQWLRGYGLTVIIDHGGGYMSVYGHASVLLAQKGDNVRRGQKIGLVGDSGSIRGPYLYFEIRKDGRPVDPQGWLCAR